MSKRVQLTRPLYVAPSTVRKVLDEVSSSRVRERMCASPAQTQPRLRAPLPAHNAPAAVPASARSSLPPKGKERSAGIHEPMHEAFVNDTNNDIDSLRSSDQPSRSLRSVSVSQVVSDENTLDTLIEKTSTLTKAERQALLDHLALQTQLSAKSATDPDIEMWSVAIKTALDDAIGSEGGDSYGSILVKRSMASPASWRPVESLMRASKLSDEDKNVRQSVYLLLAKLLVEHCLERSHYVGVPMGIKYVSQQTSSIRGLFENSFPGYLAAGLAPMIARQMQRTLR